MDQRQDRPNQPMTTTSSPMFDDNATEVGLPWSGPPVVRRESVEVAPGRDLSALVWGDRAGRVGVPPRRRPERPHLGHRGPRPRPPAGGHRPPRPRPLRLARRPGLLEPAAIADDVGRVVRPAWPPGRRPGGRACRSAAPPPSPWPPVIPSWCAGWPLVDITPGVDQEKSSDIAAFLAGPESFASFDEILERTIQFNPTRSESSLRRGVLHNAVQREDGTWTWRHQLGRPAGSTRAARGLGGLRLAVGRPRAHRGPGPARPRAASPRWSTTPTRPSSAAAGPTTGSSPSRRPGHSIQGDQPLELARIPVRSFLAVPGSEPRTGPGRSRPGRSARRRRSPRAVLGSTRWSWPRLRRPGRRRARRRCRRPDGRSSGRAPLRGRPRGPGRCGRAAPPWSARPGGRPAPSGGRHRWAGPGPAG